MAQERPDDAFIVEGCRCRNSLAESWLVRRFEGDIFRALARMRVNAADRPDICQEALMTVLRQLRAGRFEGRSSLRIWILRIATGTTIDYWRRQSRRLLKTGTPAPWPVATDADGEATFMLEEFLASLPANQRAAFCAFYQDGAPIDTVATNLMLSVSRTRAILTSLKSRLAHRLDARNLTH